MATSTALAGGALRMTAREIAAAVGGAVLSGSGETAVAGVSTDSRTIAKGNLFVALSGEKFDAHTFVAGAFEKGAACALIDSARADELRGKGTLVGVPSKDLQPALASLARAWRDRFAIPVVGITGSAGKTTAKEMTAAVLGGLGRVLKTEGNLNNRIGVPLTVMSISSEHAAAVVEMGISLPGEMPELVRAANPTVRVLLVAGIGHVEFLKDAAGVAAEKAHIWDDANPGDAMIWNADDALVSAEAARRPLGKKISFGRSETAMVRAVDVTVTGVGEQKVTLDLMGTRREARLQVAGVHLVMNALAASAAGIACEVSPDEIVAGLETRFVPVLGRGDIVRLAGDVVLVDDTYNANPTSAKAALTMIASLEEAGRKRALAVLGDMLELGPAGPEEHRMIGEHAHFAGIEGLYCFGPLMQNAAEAFPGAKHFATKAELAQTLLSDLRPGDAVLVKGSRGMKMEEVVDLLKSAKGVA